ncbi:SLC13 family permease [Lichenicoccus roseus]|uniref:TRAP transporter large permease subunit n=1 Tax=Lichenicoccus roseus TaxID=2683649 RepID=A0A5R9JHT2_9PROT|nr:SLC13 family permease [Lichenicoccus roseus]TLU73878.1 TRAP transporter large permease subunit [Lichenicoccus roseus]
MTIDEALAFGILACTVGMFVWGRLAYDLIALLALIAGIVAGIIPMKTAFDGFSDDVVVIIIGALVVSAAIARSGVVESLMNPFLPRLRTLQAQVPAMVGAVGLLSMFCKNVGALAIFMPTALQLSRRGKRYPGPLLMPMSFASLLGGLVTLIGTSPNILIAKVRADFSGHPFGMFDFTPVGLPVAILGCLFLAFGYRLVPRNRRPAGGLDAAFNLAAYTTEARLPAGSPMVGRSVRELERASDGEVVVGTILRERYRRFVPAAESLLNDGDVLLLQGDPDALERLVARARLQLGRDEAPAHAAEAEEISVVEAVVTADSTLVARTQDQVSLGTTHGLSLIALSRTGEQITRRLHAIRFRIGDVVLLRGASKQIPDALGALRVLPLAERRLTLGASHRSFLPLLVLLAAMAAAATHTLSPGVAFIAAAAIMVVLRFLTMEEAYHTVEWHVIVLLGALIPVSHAIQTTGGTALIAHNLQGVLHLVPPEAALAIILVLAMVLTPFLHNAPTVLMLGPIAASIAQQLHLNPDAFLMAVALGAGCDFLTPIGHQCNTLIYGPGGYRFGDYWRLGLPLSVIVVASGVPLITLVWGLRVG